MPHSQTEVLYRRMDAEAAEKDKLIKGGFDWNPEIIYPEETFFVRLDRYLRSKNKKWDLSGCAICPNVSDENKRRKVWRTELLGQAANRDVYFSEKTLYKWVPNVSVGENGEFVEKAQSALNPVLGQDNETTRDNLYRVAAIFGMNYAETVELFHKVFWTRPFDVKNRKELVRFFYAKKSDERDWYQKTEKFLSELNNEDEIQTSKRIVETADIVLDGIATEEDLRRFLRNNAHIFNVDNRCTTAKMLIKDWAWSAWDYAIEDFNSNYSKEDSILDMRYDRYALPTKSQLNAEKLQPEALINIILDFNVRAGISVTKFDEKILPAVLRHDFPTYDTLDSILNPESARNIGQIRLRKMLILLAFYSYCISKGESNRDLIRKDVVRKTFARDCIRAINADLEIAGFSQLYGFDPYDYLFLFCARANKPLQTFRDILWSARASCVQM